MEELHDDCLPDSFCWRTVHGGGVDPTNDSNDYHDEDWAGLVTVLQWCLTQSYSMCSNITVREIVNLNIPATFG